STRTGECAARLLARARWSRDLAAALTVPRPLGPTPDADVPEALLDRWDAIDGAARSADVATLTRLLEDSAEQEDGWFAIDGAWRGSTLASRAEAWRRPCCVPRGRAGGRSRARSPPPMPRRRVRVSTCSRAEPRAR